MRKNFLSLVVLLFCIFTLHPAFNPMLEAAEIFLMLSYSDSGKVFRVKTDYEMLKPVGLFFNCDSADGFFVDNFNDFRTLSFKEPQTYQPVRQSLFRQVFDGKPAEADTSGSKSMHQDQRNELIGDSQAKPVFRSVGAPLSCGLGRKITLRPTETEFVPGEIEIFPERNWYQIPNSSWYQTWKNYETGNGSTYLIYYDEWQKALAEIVENLWRGQFPAFAAFRPVHKLENRRLLRAVTDGTLQTIDDFGKSFVAAKAAEKFCWAFNPGMNISKGELVVYSWEDSQTGRISFIGKNKQPEILLESKQADNRFIGFASTGLLVIGTDVVRSWLKKSDARFDDSQVNCKLAAFYAEPDKNVTRIAVYSDVNNYLYRFTYNEKSAAIEPAVEKIPLQINLDAMMFDIVGNLLMASMQEAENTFNADVEPGFGVETMMFDHSGELAEFDEEQGRYVNHEMPDRITGRLVFSKGFREAVFVLEVGSNQIRFINDVDLGKKYFCREFSLSRPPAELLNYTYSQVAVLAKKPGNRLDELKGEVPGFPDQFQKPEKVFIGFFQQ